MRPHPSRWPWWVQVLAVHALARAASAVIFVAVARIQAATPWGPATPSYLQYTGLMWDGSWYRQIAESGYPAVLPYGADGRVLQNPWAFFPLFPALARGLMVVTAAPWQVVAPALALVLGALAMLVVHRLVADVAGGVAAGVAPTGPGADRVRRWLPLATVAVLTTVAPAPVLQTAYSEALALLLIVTALLCLRRRRYLLAVPVVVALGLTRAVALPLAVAVAAHAVVRWHAARRGEPFTVADQVRVGVLVVVAVASGLLWPAVTGWVTDRPDAYTLTQAAWRGSGQFVPVRPWLDVSRWLFGSAGPFVLAAVLLGTVAVLASRPARRLGPEMAGWAAGYLGYLVAVIEPWTSLVRFLLLAFPLVAAAAAVALRSRWWRAGLTTLVVLGVMGQVAWVGLLWRLVPPSGWPP